MVSVIICSRSTQDFEKVQQNIAETIGVVHQVIRIDNSTNAYSISRAYNEGAKQSVYPTLCFVHEDVAFVSQDWGRKLQELLRDPEIGLVGVAGGILKTKATGPTWWSPLSNSVRINLIQQTAQGQTVHLLENPFQEKQSEVVVLDGVFMGCRKVTWHSTPFDEHTIKGFHFYDLDFSLSVGSFKKVVVTYDIFLTHFSEGKNDKIWAEQADNVIDKWKDRLPRYVGDITDKDLENAESQTEDLYLNVLFKNGCEKTLILKYLMKRVWHNPKDIGGNLFFFRKLLQ